MTNPKDAFGHTLQPGDKVMHVCRTGRYLNLNKEVVSGFTPSGLVRFERGGRGNAHLIFLDLRDRMTKD